MKTKINIYILLLFIAGLLIRLHALWQTDKDPLFNHYTPPHDSFFNIRAAEEWNHSEWYPEKTGNFVPNHPYKYLLFCIFSMSDSPIFWVRLLQSLLSLAGIFLLYLAIKKIDIRYAFAVTLLAIFNGDLILYDLQILKYSMINSLTMISIYLMTRYFAHPSKKVFIYNLSIIYILGQLRTFYYLFGFFLFFRRFRHNPYSFWTLFFVFNVGIALFGLLFLPADLKNHIGIHMYHGFHRFSNGFYTNIPFVRDNTLGHFHEGLLIGKELSNHFPHFSFLNNFWLQKVFHFMSSFPHMTLLLLIKKGYYLFLNFDWNDTVDILYMDQKLSFRSIAIISFPFLPAFGFLGLFAFLSNSIDNIKKHHHVWLASLLIPAAAVLGTCLNRRYQSLLVPGLCIFGGIGIVKLFEWIKDKEWKRLIFSSLILIIFAFHFMSYQRNDWEFDKRFRYWKMRNEFNIEGQAVLEKWMKKNSPPDFDALKKAILSLKYGDNSIDSIGLIKKWLAKENISPEEKYWCYEEAGRILLTQELYSESLVWFKKAYALKPSEDLLKMISDTKFMKKVTLNPDSYP